MNLIFTNPVNGRSTTYTPAQLRREVQAVAKGRGTVTASYVEVVDGRCPRLRVEVRAKSGVCEVLNVAI